MISSLEIVGLLEIVGVLALLLGVTGVILNNRRLRVCFIVWMVGNILSASVHISVGVWSLLARDIIFFVLSIEGWFKWGKKKDD